MLEITNYRRDHFCGSSDRGYSLCI